MILPLNSVLALKSPHFIFLLLPETPLLPAFLSLSCYKDSRLKKSRSQLPSTGKFFVPWLCWRVPSALDHQSRDHVYKQTRPDMNQIEKKVLNHMHVIHLHKENTLTVRPAL